MGPFYILQKFYMGIIKCIIQWKNVRSHRPETFAHRKKSKKLNFSVTIFCNFFNGFEISIKFLILRYPYWIFEEKSVLGVLLALFLTFKSNSAKQVKKRKDVFYKLFELFLKLNFESQVVKTVVPYCPVRSNTKNEEQLSDINVRQP